MRDTYPAQELVQKEKRKEFIYGLLLVLFVILFLVVGVFSFYTFTKMLIDYFASMDFDFHDQFGMFSLQKLSDVMNETHEFFRSQCAEYPRFIGSVILSVILFICFGFTMGKMMSIQNKIAYIYEKKEIINEFDPDSVEEPEELLGWTKKKK